MMYLKQSTSVDVGIGPFLDEADGKTPETTLTITQPDVRLKKNGGAWAQKAAAQTLSHEEAGWYELTLDATDTDTIGHLRVAIHESGALPVWQEYHVLAANVYDSLFGAASDKLDVNVEEWNTTAVPSEHTAGYPIVTVKDGTGTGELDTASGVVLAKDHAGANLATATALDTVDNFLDTEIAAIKAVTDALPNAGALTSLATQASVNTIDDFLDTEIAAIQAKTDLIPGTIDGKSFSELVTLIAAVLLGKASGLATTTAVYRAADDSKDRVTATVDADGNRSAVTLDAS